MEKYCTSSSSSVVVDWNAYKQSLSQELETSAQYSITKTVDNLLS